MRFLNGVCFLLAVLLLLGYLIARPHIGTLYTVRTTLTNVQSLKTLNAQAYFPYTSRSECERKAEAWEQEYRNVHPNMVASAVCVPETRLLWGW